jgi:imidazolonepropionase-like amidohydrolase
MSDLRNGTRILRLRSRLLSIAIVLGFTAPIGDGLSAGDLALVGAKIYLSPTQPPIESGTIVTHDGLVSAVGTSAEIKPPAGASILDCHRLVITAGFWNSHVHILTQGLMGADKLPADKISAQLEEMLTRWGFTTVFDVASVLDNTLAIRRRITGGEVKGPRILTVGDPFYPKGGTPVYVKGFLESNHVPSCEVDTTEQAVARVRKQIAAGADGAKIFAASFAAGGKIVPMPQEIATAIVTEAHRGGKPAFAHPSNMEGIEIAIRSGVDVLAHTAPLSGPWPPELIKRMKANRIALVPTLTLFEVDGKKFGESAEDIAAELKVACGQLKSYADSGGQVLFGTDVGYTDFFDTAEEYKLMKGAGLSFQQILASLTTSPADRFGYSGRSGRIAPDMAADLVVLDGDPANEITALAKVHYVILNGKMIYTTQRN